jgi:hypothetical protein
VRQFIRVHSSLPPNPRVMDTANTVNPWLVALLLAIPILSRFATGAVNRRFTARARQPARGAVVGRRALAEDERRFLKGIARDVYTHQTVRKNDIVTGYVARIGALVLVCRLYRLGRQGAYVGIADLEAPAPALAFHASPLHLLLRVVDVASIALLTVVANFPWWGTLLLAVVLAGVFWFDHRNEKEDLLAHLRTVMQRRAEGEPAKTRQKAKKSRSNV